jgi:PAS domain S-box-containing protein
LKQFYFLTNLCRNQSGQSFMTDGTAGSSADRRYLQFADIIGRAGPELLQDNGFFRELLNVLPAAVYATDASGSVVYYNESAVEIWGRRPELGKTKWCGSWRLFWADGRELPHDQCPMAVAVRDKRAVRGIEAIVERPDGSRVSLIPHPTPFFDDSGTFLGAVNLMVDISERKRTEELTKRLAQEAEHRTRNILSAVTATVTLSNSETTDGLKKAIHGRIQALANVNELFVQSRWAGADLHRLVAQELSPYCQDGEARVQFSGPHVMLPADLAQCVAVAVHELATNAAKYGALSAPQGRVSVDWSHASSLVIRWVEAGGPRTAPPTHSGFGTRVLHAMIRHQLGEIRFDWQTQGLVCEIILPGGP